VYSSPIVLGLFAASLALSTWSCAGSSNGSPTASAGNHSTGGATSGGNLGTGGALTQGGRLGTGGLGGNGGGAGLSMTSGGVTTGGAASGGNAPLAGSSGAGATATNAGAGGATANGGAGAAASSGAGGLSTGGSAGSSSAAPHGSAAKFICEPGKSYGDPLEGMGAVMQVGPPPSDYFAFIEGPIWIAKANALFFSDNASSPTERIFKLPPPFTTAAPLVSASSSNGLGVDNDDRIVACDQDAKAITRFDPATGAPVGTPISTGTAKPNDVVVRSDDNIYFSDPDTGFYRISPSGALSAAMRLTQGSRPNGIALSLDEKILYVGDVGNKSISKYTLGADGSVDTSSPTALVTATKSDTADGMCVDCAGNVYVGTSNGVEIYSPAGDYVGTVPTGESSNCTFGGPDRKTLFVTSRAVLKYVTLNVPGLPD
jgi:gluconolactonase